MEIRPGKYTVVVELKILCVVETGYGRGPQRAAFIESWLNDSCHCLDTELEMLKTIYDQRTKEVEAERNRGVYILHEEETDENCFCAQTEAKYIREATEQDHADYGYLAWQRSREGEVIEAREAMKELPESANEAMPRTISLRANQE